MKDLNQMKTLSMRKKFFQILVCILVLMVSFFGMVKLAGSKKPPVKTENEEQALRVEAVSVQPSDVPVVITAYGKVQPLRVVAISPEVSGTLVEIHPRLRAGEIIPKGETLFRVDDRNYNAATNEALASEMQWKNTIKRLKKQHSIDRQRLKTLERNQELSDLEFQRLRGLYDKDQVGTRSSVEKAEQAFNAALDRVDQMKQALALYPISH